MLRRIRSWLALLVAAAMLLLAVAPAAAAPLPGPLTETQALELLTYYNLVRGDPDGSLRLYDPITRAEAAAIFVRAVGKEDEAERMSLPSPFLDTQGHWASPVIAMAAQLGLVKGDGNGMYRPNDSITYAEVLTVLLRIVEREPAGPWRPVVIYQAANSLGFAPYGVDVNQPALRGRIFHSLAGAIATVPLSSGLTPLQAYVDGKPPVIQLDEEKISTTESQVTISGTADDAAWVEVNGRRATLNPTNGAFTYTASVDLGTTRLTVEAADRANNRSTATVTVERRHPTARLEISGPSVIQAGKSVKLTVTAYDQNGRQTGLEGLEYEITGGVATFNPKTLTLTAGKKAGEGTLTLRVGSARATYRFYVGTPSDDAEALEIQEINRGRPLTPDKSYTVKVRVVNDRGRLEDEDYGREVTLKASGLSGVTITPQTALTEEGIATFTIKSSKQGTFTLKATSRGLEGDEVELEVYDFPIIVLEASPSSASPGETVWITAELQDEDGDPVKNKSSRDIEIELRGAGSYGELVDDVLVIKKNESASKEAAEFRVGSKTGSVTITGRMESRHDYYIKPVTISIKKSSVSPSTLRFVIEGPKEVQIAGQPVELTLKVVDEKGQKVTDGHYAFQVDVAPKEGAAITLGDTQWSPLSGSSTIARTVNGEAKLRLTYSGSGTVTVTPVGAGQSYVAHDAVTQGWAWSSLGFKPGSGAELEFTLPVADLDLSVTSGLGTGLQNGAMPLARDAESIITVKALDQSGQVLTRYPGSATIEKVSGEATRGEGDATKQLTDGTATFQVKPAGQKTGVDTYQVTVGAITKTFTVAVRDQKLTPVIEAVNTENGLEVVLGPVRGQPYWAHVQIAVDNNEVYNQVVDLAAQRSFRLDSVRPQDGPHVVAVKVNNGAGWSEPVTMRFSVGPEPTYGIESAWYDAVAKQLTLRTNLPNGRLDPTKLTVVQEGAPPVSLQGAAVVTLEGNAGFVLNVEALDGQLRQLAGAVNLLTDEGWYVAEAADTVVPAHLTTPVKPMVRVTSAQFDEDSLRLVLKGAGLDHGWLVWDRIHVQAEGNDPVSLTGVLLEQTADSITLVLNDSLGDLTGGSEPPKLTITLDDGWLVTSDGFNRYRAAGGTVPLTVPSP